MAELLFYFAKKPSIEIHLILYGLNREVFYDLPGNVVLHKPSFQFDNRLRFWYTLRTLLFLRFQIRKIKPHSILSFGEYWNSLVLIATLGLNVRRFVSDRCQPDRSLGTLHDWLRVMLYPTCNGIIAQTQKAKAIYESMYTGNIVVIGNPIRKIERDTAVGRENIIVTVGRLVNTKHHDRLIKLFLKIGKPDWKLIIVGDNALRQNKFQELSKLITELRGEERVTLAGIQKDVDRFYVTSKIFAFTSSSEGFPNVIGEALASGTPVVSYDCVAGPSEMVKDGVNGFLIPLFDDELFKTRLESLMSNEHLRINMGVEARLGIDVFSVESIGEKYYKLLMS